MADGKAGRPQTVEKKTTLSIRIGLTGWLEFRTRGESGGVSGYLMDLAEADRAKAATEHGEDWDRYLMYLRATQRDEELDAVSKLTTDNTSTVD